ncbi:unnamed protein product [Mytilus edulis]|uniref:DM2 domain-containing protein n=1 Tax=Mytilus edulis TaxID=6550 RepID=A0A8S3PPG7_MYTED|nr:unnamed protein product [Mytilus edulis]
MHNYTVSGQVTSSQVNMCNNPNLIVRQPPDTYSTPAGSNVSTLKQLTESHYITTEECEVNYPMVRPRREFLDLLKQVGASWEVLTRKEVCSYLKDYIGSRQLYNQNDPSIVFCKKDPLGKVFGVDKFTFTEATSKQRVDEVVLDTDSDSDQEFFIDCINEHNTFINDKNKVKRDQAFATINVCSKPIKFKLDTGSQVNILPKHIFESLKFNGTLKKSPRILTAYNGNALPSLGVCCLPCEHGSVNSKLEFYCLDTNSPPILGMQSCLDYELIKLVYSTETTCTSDSDPMTKSSVLKDYSDIFKGVGLVSGKATIHIDSEVPPVVHPPRRVPVALRGRLKSELDRMVNADIICKVNGPTPWVNSLVVVEKPNDNAEMPFLSVGSVICL